MLARHISQAQPQAQGAAQAGATASITLAASSSSDKDRYTGMWILLTAGTGVNQLREIGAYDGGSKIASVTQQWRRSRPDHAIPDLQQPVPDAGGRAYPFNLPANMPLIETRSYLAALGTSLPEVYGALSAPVAQGHPGRHGRLPHPRGVRVRHGQCLCAHDAAAHGGAGAGQQRQVTAHDGASRKATVDHPWLSLPDASTRYAIIDPLAADRETAGLNIEQYRVVTTPVSDAATLASISLPRWT